MKPIPPMCTARLFAGLVAIAFGAAVAAQDSSPAPGQATKKDDPPKAPSSSPDSAPKEGGTAPAPSTGQNEGTAKPRVLVLPRKKLERKAGDDSLIRGVGYAKGLRYGLPPGWIPVKPTNSMRLAEMTIPAPQGSGLGDGLMTVVGGVGGTPDENVDRWLGQFQQIRGTPVRELFVLDGLTITQLSVTGAFSSEMPGAGAGAAASARPGTVMLAAMVEGGSEGPVFFKAVGPEAVIESNRFGWEVLLRTLRVHEKK